MTYLGPYEAELLEHREAFPLDREAHAATWTDWDGNLVCAHGHVDRAQEELEKDDKVSVSECAVYIIQ